MYCSIYLAVGPTGTTICLLNTYKNYPYISFNSCAVYDLQALIFVFIPLWIFCNFLILLM